MTRPIHPHIDATERPRCPGCGEKEWAFFPGEQGNPFRELFCKACKCRFSTNTRRKRHFPDFDPVDVTQSKEQ